MKKIILTMVLLSGMIMYGQAFQWLKTPLPDEANVHNTPYTSTVDPSGNIYFTGFKDTPILLNDLMGNVLYNKYDSDGELIFSKEFSGKCVSYNIQSDSQGNIILALGYVETLTIGTTTLTSIGDDIKRVLVKLDTEGNLLWYKQLYMDGFDLGIIEDFRSIAVDTDDNIYAGYDNYMYSYITKYSAGGDKLFTIEQHNVNRITSVAVDTEGNIYSAGACADISSEYAGVAAPTDFNYTTYIAKYSPLGVFQWVKYVEDITCPEPHVVANTPDEIYFSSYLFTENDFGAIDIEGPGNSFEDIFITKLNASGDFQWVREASGSGKAGLGYRNYLSIDSQGNVYFAGKTAGTLNWGNGITTTIDSFQSDILVLKYNPEGNLLFAKTAGGASEDRLDSISVDNEGNIFVTGIGNGDGTFDEIEHEVDNSDYYPFLAKISMEVLGLDKPEAKQITVYPNPASGIINISGIEYPAKAIILNALGQTVKNIEDISIKTIDISNLPQGTYFLKTDGYKTQKIIKK